MITEFSGEYRFLSNFYEIPDGIVFRGVTYFTTENAFQAAKCSDPEDAKYIATCSPGEAKRRGKECSRVSFWDEDKYKVMLELIRLKFAVPELRAMLLRTGYQPIVEGNNWHDNYWGNCMCPQCLKKPGANVLGNLLMQVRVEIR